MGYRFGEQQTSCVAAYTKVEKQKIIQIKKEKYNSFYCCFTDKGVEVLVGDQQKRQALQTRKKLFILLKELWVL